MPRAKSVTFTPAATDDDGISAAQTLGGAGNLLLNGALGSSLDYARILDLTSTGNLSGINFTFTGTDADGRTITEVKAGPNNNTVSTVNYYKTITSIAADAAVGTNIKIGTNAAGQLASKMYPANIYSLTTPAYAVTKSGTINFTVQECFDDVRNGAIANWFSLSALASKTANTQALGTIHAQACRIILTSYSTGVSFTLNIIQSSGEMDV